MSTDPIHTNTNANTPAKQDNNQNMNVKPVKPPETVRDDKGNFKTVEPAKVAPAK